MADDKGDAQRKALKAFFAKNPDSWVNVSSPKEIPGAVYALNPPNTSQPTEGGSVFNEYFSKLHPPTKQGEGTMEEEEARKVIHEFATGNWHTAINPYEVEPARTSW